MYKYSGTLQQIERCRKWGWTEFQWTPFIFLHCWLYYFINYFLHRPMLLFFGTLFHKYQYLYDSFHSRCDKNVTNMTFCMSAYFELMTCIWRWLGNEVHCGKRFVLVTIDSIWHCRDAKLVGQRFKPKGNLTFLSFVPAYHKHSCPLRLWFISRIWFPSVHNADYLP